MYSSSANSSSAALGNATWCNTTCDCTFGYRCSNTSFSCVKLAGGGDDDNATTTPNCGNSSLGASLACLTSNDCSVGYRCTSNLTCVALSSTAADDADDVGARGGSCQTTADCSEGYRCDEPTLTCVELSDADDWVSVALLDDDDGKNAQGNSSIDGYGDAGPAADVGATAATNLTAGNLTSSANSTNLTRSERRSERRKERREERREERNGEDA